jgi:hypothetical protein
MLRVITVMVPLLAVGTCAASAAELTVPTKKSHYIGSGNAAVKAPREEAIKGRTDSRGSLRQGGDTGTM